jgi:hypothetical protein
MRSKYPPQLSEINLPGNLFSYLGHFRESWIGALSSRDFYRIEVLNGTCFSPIYDQGIGRCSKYCQRAKYCQLPIKRTIVIIYTINYFWNTFATIFFRLIVYLIVYCISSAFSWQLTVFGTPPYYGAR